MRNLATELLATRDRVRDHDAGAADLDAIWRAATVLTMIHRALSGQEWNADTPGYIAELLQEQGFTIKAVGADADE